jgi:signal transduction histidine kinase
LVRTIAAEVFLLGYAGTLLALVRAPAALRRRPALRPLLEDSHFAFLLGAVTSTGGLQSPLLLALLTVTPARVLSGGWSRRTRMHVLIVCGAAFAMAVLPGAWFGSPLPPRNFAGIAALALASGVLLHSHYIGFLSRTVEESVWDAVQAREQVAAQALARTRELEHLGARLSHELKNPLAAIKALAQLAGRAAGDPDARESLDTIVSEAERMRHVVDEYLSFSRPLEKLRLEPVSLRDLAQEVLAVLAGRADEAGVALEASGDAVAVADPRRLKEALLNLVANAIEATPSGGRVSAVVSADGDLARVTVTDTGAGMAPEVLARIGTAFYTTRESGTGLGVLLARTVFKQHGGGLTYESTPGAGTVAVATLAITGPERSDSHAEAAFRG